MGTLGRARLAAAAGRARTLGMDGERRASQALSSGLPEGGAGGESPGDGGPVPGSSCSSALLQAEVLDLDEDEDDLEVFSKVRAEARPGKVPSQLRELAGLCDSCPGALALPRPRIRAGGGWGLPWPPDPAWQLAAPGAASRPVSDGGRSLLCTLTFRRAGLWLRGVCKVAGFLFLFLLFSSLAGTSPGTVPKPGRRWPEGAPAPSSFFFGRSQP